MSQSVKNIAVSTDAAPLPVGPYSQAVVSAPNVFVAGQMGVDPATGSLVEGGVAAQATQAMKNMSAILEEAGSSIGSLVKTTVFLANFDDFAAVNEVYGQFLGDVLPARSAFEVSRLPLGAEVEIEAIATLC